jgi:hypothetical protein
MGLRFRRRLSIAPGVLLNLGKRGASLSVGRRGARITIGHGQIRETVGLPGTGISYTATTGRRRRQVRKQASIPMTLFVLGILVYVVIYAALHALGVVG